MQYIIDFKDEISKSNIDQYLLTINGTIIKTFNSFEKTFLVEVPNELSFDETLHSNIIRDDTQPISLLNTVIQLDKSHFVNTLDGEINTITMSNSNDWWKTYSLFEPNLDAQSIQFDRRGTGTIVYLLDSGVKTNHPEFTNRNIVNLFSINDNFDDNRGHGTAIASVIVGNTCGITNSTIKSVKIFENNYATKQSDLVAALDAIYQDFINTPNELAVVNCSWIIDKNLYIESKIQSLINAGLYFVVSAGNNGSAIENVTPASMDSVITIGSYNKDLMPSNFSAYTNSVNSLTNSYTNAGAIDGWSPGEEIYVATINGSYGLTAGTSIAAGIHSAVLTYNIAQLSESSILNSPYESVYQTLLQLSFKKDQLLDLSDPKYQNSTNKISTILDQYPIQDLKPLSFYKIISNKKVFVKVIALPSTASEIELLDDLPQGLSINSRGCLIGRVTSITDVSVYNIRMNIKTENNDIFENTLELIIIPETYNIENDSTGDSDLDVKIRLNTVICSINNCTFDPDCYDDCFDGWCIAAYGKPYGCIQNSTYCGCRSDERVKENIKPLSNVLDKLKNLNAYYFNYKTMDDVHIGLMAQQVEKEFPELIRYNNGVRHVLYGNAVAILIEGIKELQQEIEDLKSKKS